MNETTVVIPFTDFAQVINETREVHIRSIYEAMALARWNGPELENWRDELARMRFDLEVMRIEAAKGKIESAEDKATAPIPTNGWGWES